VSSGGTRKPRTRLSFEPGLVDLTPDPDASVRADNAAAPSRRLSKKTQNEANVARVASTSACVAGGAPRKLISTSSWRVRSHWNASGPSPTLGNSTDPETSGRVSAPEEDASRVGLVGALEVLFSCPSAVDFDRLAEPGLTRV
jgi:hypothetical protein